MQSPDDDVAQEELGALEPTGVQLSNPVDAPPTNTPDAIKELMQAFHRLLKDHDSSGVEFQAATGVPIQVLASEPFVMDGIDYAKLTVDYNSPFELNGREREPFPLGLRQVFAIKMFPEHWSRVISGFWTSRQEGVPVNHGDPEDRSSYILDQLRQFIDSNKEGATWFYGEEV